MTRWRTVVPDLPKYVNDDYDTGVIRAVLDYTENELVDEFRSTVGHERQAVREQLCRFREETLAGVMAGPHIPMGEAAAESLRAFAWRMDLRVAKVLSEP